MSQNDDSQGQVSETSAMSPSAGEGGVPGTDDGVPTAGAAGQEADGGPRDYDAERDAPPADE
ncbi:hypothetical protein [Agilicoccus flavus]|uniref:hypothetical protein n=1 Tax=Agilicoccus flavus TaxID=2775968 RepID=UPI001CF6C949|nr:hypothetical protein [Agilicoccus flavus]